MTNTRLLTFVFFLTLLFGSSATAQHLRRKGALGISYIEASDSLMRSLRVLDTRGVLVKEVAANSTAAQLGLQPNDVLVAINEADSLYEYDFLKATQQLYENDPIAVTFVRNRRKTRVVGRVLPTPRESTTSASEVLYDEVAYQRGYLRSIVHRPRGSSGKSRAIFYLQDYNCRSIDFSIDSLNPTKQLINGWVKAGFVVYRLEKPGVGESSGIKDCSRLSYLEEVAAFEKGLSALKKYNFVDSNRVFLFGYSVGGTIAPLLANRQKVRGIITYGTVVKPWFEHMIDVFRKQGALKNQSYQSVEANTRMLTPLLYEWLITGKTGAELMQNPEFEAILTAKENPLQYSKGTFLGRQSAYFTELNQQNIAQAWGLAALPTLAIHGEFDVQATSPEAAQTIAAIVNETRAGRGTYKMLKGGDHFLVKAASLDEYLKISQSDSFLSNYAPKHFNSEIVEMTVGWLNQQK